MALLAKLLKDGKVKVLGLDTKAWMDYRFAPHLIYANLAFDSDLRGHDASRLIKWCEAVGPNWGKKRIVAYLDKHQSEFRDCLRWLIDDAPVDLDYLHEGCDAADRANLPELEPHWRREREVRFLQLHSITHGKINLQPRVGPAESGVAQFWGVNLGQGRARDPLDPICWHLLHLLMRDGILTIRQCRYWGCERFFQVQTARREYCSDLCRSKAHPRSKKENREYMRKHRALLRRRRELKAKREGRVIQQNC